MSKQHDSGNKQGLEIVIMVKGEDKAKQLCVSRFWFKGNVGVIEWYKEAVSGYGCITCYGIRYEKMGNYGDWSLECIICS